MFQQKITSKGLKGRCFEGAIKQAGLISLVFQFRKKKIGVEFDLEEEVCP